MSIPQPEVPDQFPPTSAPPATGQYPAAGPFAAGPFTAGPGEQIPRGVLVLAASENLGSLLAAHAPNRDPNRLILPPVLFGLSAVFGFADPLGDGWRIDFLPARAVLFVIAVLSTGMVAASLVSNPYLNPVAGKRRLYLYEAGLVLFSGGRAELFRWEAVTGVKQSTTNSRRRTAANTSWKVVRADGKRVSISGFYAAHEALGAEVTRRWRAVRSRGAAPGAAAGRPGQ